MKDLDAARQELAAWAAKHADTLEFLDTTFGIDSRTKSVKRSIRAMVASMIEIWLDPDRIQEASLDLYADGEKKKHELS